nr:hypothetical protein [Tanacetum cinerariifolium]
AVEESLKTAHAVHRGPLPPVVIREPKSGKYQPPPEVPGKGKAKAKVTENQVAHDLLSLQKAKRKNPVEQYIFQRRIFEPTRSFFHDESPYDVLGQSDNEEESKKVLTEAFEGGNDDAGSKPDVRSEGQAGPDPDIQEVSYYQEYQENVAKHRGFLAGETRSTQDLPTPKPTKPARKPKSTAQKAPLKPSISTLVISTQLAPTSAPAKSQENKRK